MAFILCHRGERVLDESRDAEVVCNATAHPHWVDAVKDAGGPDVAFGRCMDCGEPCDPEASAIRAWFAQAFESASSPRKD